MTTKSIFSAAFILLAVVFTSCSTSVDIAKRHHNNGYYIHIASKKQVSSPVADVAAPKKDVQSVATNEVKSEPVAAETKIITPVAKEKGDENLVSASTDLKPAFSSVKKQLKKAIASSEVNASENHKAEFIKYNYAQKHFSKKATRPLTARDAPGIVLILLCIFLPPVAVGIVADWGKRFWIDLLLTLLFYFPGMIYAFIVCFS